MSAAGAAVGLLGGSGFALVVHRLPLGWRPTLETRLATRLPAVSAAPLLRRDLAACVARRFDDLVGGRASVRRRLQHSGSTLTVEQVRLEQLVWGAAALAVALVVLAPRAAQGEVPLVPAAVLCGCAAVAGTVLRDRALTRAAGRRQALVEAELPPVAELLALALTAGESATGALHRVSTVSSGALTDELRRVVAETRGGVPFAAALEAMSERLGCRSVDRLVAAVRTATERGTPLADVVRAQAQDARDVRRRRLMDEAGRREIAMLVPVVFLLLPVTVVFALFPGLYGLDLAA